MKNSASNPSITQALRAQAAHILPVLTAALATLGYDEICHQRIGQQPVNQQHYHKAIRYQGLTCAQHSQFGCVMIKWALTPYHKSDLSHEWVVLQALNNSQQSQNDTALLVPPILASTTSHLQVLDQTQQFTALVMPHYKNGSLAHYLRQYLSQQHLNIKKNQPLTNKKKHHFIIQATRLIANLHNAGWLHNDIKPSNILLDGFSKSNVDNSSITPDLLLTDFALAERINKPRKANTAGTPAYLAPERWQGQSATQQSDIYAFGIMVYEILTGGRPFKINHQSSDPMIDWATQHCQQPIPVLLKEYQHYQMVIDTALAKRVERRYQSMEAVLEDLEILKNS